MRGVLFCAVALLLGSCFAVRQSNPVTLKGHFSVRHGQAQLLRCGDAQRHLVEDPSGLLNPAYQELLAPAPPTDESVYAVLSGFRSAKNTFRVLRVDSLTRLGLIGGCLPYEFYAAGTEPFWSVRVSPTEGILYKNMADNSAILLPFERAAQSAQGNTWTYSTRVEGKNVQLTVQKEMCSDGMSDRAYDYKATLNVNGKTYTGCATRWGAAVAVER